MSFEKRGYIDPEWTPYEADDEKKATEKTLDELEDSPLKRIEETADFKTRGRNDKTLEK